MTPDTRPTAAEAPRLGEPAPGEPTPGEPSPGDSGPGERATPAGDARLLWTLGLASFASMASMRACDALLPQIASEFAASTGAAAGMIAAFAVAYGLLQVVYGPMGDRHGKGRVMGCAVLGCAVANLAVAAAPTLDAGIAARALAGAAAGGIVPLSIASIGDSVDYERRQETLARLSLATIGGMIAGQWLGGVLADALGWRAVFFLLAGGFAAVAWPVWRWALRSPRPRADASTSGRYGQQLLQLWQAPWARTVLFVASVEGMVALAPLTLLPSHLHDAFGLSLGEAGAVTALYGVGGLCFALGSARLIRRLGERGLVLAGGGALAVAIAMLAIAPDWRWACPACFVAGVGFYMLHSTMQTHATQMLPAVRGTAVSVFVVCLFGGQSLGVLLAAAVVDLASARWVFGVCSVVIALLCGWFAVRLSAHARARQA